MHSRTEQVDEISWPERERQWQPKLGRIRLGAEPVEVQLERYRRVTWALTIVPLLLATFIVALFAAFRRPDVGAILGAVLFVPVVAFAWFDFVRLRGRVEEYLIERERLSGSTQETSAH